MTMSQGETFRSDGHKHARALRLVGREILRGLHETARDYYQR